MQRLPLTINASFAPFSVAECRSIAVFQIAGGLPPALLQVFPVPAALLTSYYRAINLRCHANKVSAVASEATCALMLPRE